MVQVFYMTLEVKMGACSFSLTIDATNEKQFAKAFHDAAAEDRYENGHDSYSGTIGQKSGWRMLSATPVSRARLAELKEKHEGDKWGDAMACPVAEEKLVGKPKIKKVKVEAGDSWEADSLACSQLNGKVKVLNRTVLKEAVYVLEKVETQVGWRVEFGWNKVSYGTKSECLKLYKEKLMAGETAKMVYIDPVFKRVLKKQTLWEVEVEIQETQTTTNISHYAVWGWAAE